MKNIVKIMGFIAITAIIGFSMIACGGEGGDPSFVISASELTEAQYNTFRTEINAEFSGAMSAKEFDYSPGGCITASEDFQAEDYETLSSIVLAAGTIQLNNAEKGQADIISILEPYKFTDGSYEFGQTHIDYAINNATWGCAFIVVKKPGEATVFVGVITTK